MATNDNKFGIHVAASKTVTMGRTSTVAEDGVAGLAQRGVVFCSFFTMANDASANLNGNSGTVVEGSDESYIKTTGYDGSNKMVEIQNGNVDSGKVNLVINQTEADKTIKIQDASVLNVELTGSGVKKLDGSWTNGGNLTIPAGTLDTVNSGGTDHSLTVEGLLHVDGGTLTCNDSTLTLGQADTDSGMALYNSAGTINGGTGDWTVASLRHHSGTTTLTSGTIILNGKDPSSAAALDVRNSGMTHPSGGLIQLGVEDGNILFYGHNAINLHHLEIISSGHYIVTDDTDNVLTIAGNLTIDQGELNTHKSGKDVLSELVVGGDIFVSPQATAGTNKPSTLTCNGSDITVTGKLQVNGTWHSGSSDYVPDGNFIGGTGDHEYNSVQFLSGGNVALTSGNTEIKGEDGGAAFRMDTQNGYSTWSHGSGTVTFTGTSDPQKLYSQGQSADAFTQFHNLIIEKGTGDMVQGLTTVGFHIKVANDLTIKEGGLNCITTNGTSHDLTAGSITIESGGILEGATDKTIKVTSEVGTKCWDNQAGGTFTHNNGKVLFDSTIGDTTFDNAGADPFYDLEVKTNGDCKYLNAVTVENDLTMNHSNLSFGSNTDGSGAITVYGTTRLVDGSAFTGSTDNVNDDYYGFIVVEGGQFRTSEGNPKRCRGIKQTGGTIT